MKRLGLLAVFVLGLWAVCRAEVTATIIAKDIDNDGNIRVWTQYKIDGKEVDSRDPKIDDKYVRATRYNVLNFYGMTDEQVKEYILKDIGSYVNHLVIKEYTNINTKIFLENNLTGLVNSSISTSTADIGLSGKTLTVKIDGTQIADEKATP